MTDCAAPRHEEPVDAETGAYLCRPCREGMSRNLRKIPGLYALLGEALVTALQKRSPGSERGLPMNEPVSDCMLQIHHDLTYWTMEVIRDRGLAIDLDDTVPALAGFLHGWMRLIPFRGWAGDMAGAISEDAGRARSLLDPWVTKRFELPGADGLCLACRDAGTDPPGRMEATIYASDGDRRRPVLTCGVCGESLAPEQWLRYGERVIQRRESVA